MSAQNKNEYKVVVELDRGCSFDDGEYSMYIIEIVNGVVSFEDVELVKDFIDNEYKNEDFPMDDYYCRGFLLTVEETGEREDVFWHKYYQSKDGAKPQPLEAEAE